MIYFYVLAVLIFGLDLDACYAEEAKGGVVPVTAGIMEEKAPGAIKHIDVSEPENMGREEDTGMNKGRFMEPWESYDEETGLPAVTASDAAGQFE